MSTEVADPDPVPVEEEHQDRIQSQITDGVTAQLRLTNADLFLCPTLEQATDVTVEPEYWTTVETGHTFVLITVIGRSFTEFEDALIDDPTITQPVLVDQSPNKKVYRVQIADCVVPFMDLTAMSDGYVRNISSIRQGWQVQLRFPDREHLVTFNEYCRERGISVSVDHLRIADDETEAVVPLTEKQQELLTVALQEGYFEVPRGITQNELADQFGLSKSAVSQRIRRGIRELCTEALR